MATTQIHSKFVNSLLIQNRPLNRHPFHYYSVHSIHLVCLCHQEMKLKEMRRTKVIPPNSTTEYRTESESNLKIIPKALFFEYISVKRSSLLLDSSNQQQQQKESETRKKKRCSKKIFVVNLSFFLFRLPRRHYLKNTNSFCGFNPFLLNLFLNIVDFFV